MQRAWRTGGGGGGRWWWAGCGDVEEEGVSWGGGGAFDSEMTAISAVKPAIQKRKTE